MSAKRKNVKILQQIVILPNDKLTTQGYETYPEGSISNNFSPAASSTAIQGSLMEIDGVANSGNTIETIAKFTYPSTDIKNKQVASKIRETNDGRKNAKTLADVPGIVISTDEDEMQANKTQLQSATSKTFKKPRRKAQNLAKGYYSEGRIAKRAWSRKPVSPAKWIRPMETLPSSETDTDHYRDDILHIRFNIKPPSIVDQIIKDNLNRFDSLPFPAKSAILSCYIKMEQAEQELRMLLEEFSTHLDVNK